MDIAVSDRVEQNQIQTVVQVLFVQLDGGRQIFDRKTGCVGKTICGEHCLELFCTAGKCQTSVSAMRVI